MFAALMTFFIQVRIHLAGSMSQSDFGVEAVRPVIT